MPELSKLGSYRLPSLRYTPPRFDFSPAPALVPSTAAGAGLRGSAISMSTVAESLAALPDIITGGVEKGRKLAEREEVGKIKMGALTGGLTDEQRKAYSGMVFGADNSLALKTEDPELELLKAQVYAGKLNPQTPYQKTFFPQTSAPGTGGALSGGIRPPVSSANNAAVGVVDGGVTPGSVLPPLPPGDAMGDTANLPAATVVPPPATGALSSGFQFGAGVAPATGALGGQNATSLEANKTPVEPTPATNGIVIKRPAKEGDPAEMWENGRLIKVFPPGATGWENVPQQPKPAAIPGAAQEAAIAAKLGIPAETWAAMPEPERAAKLREAAGADKKGYEFGSVEEAKAYAEANGFESPNVTQRNGKIFVDEFKPREVDTKGKIKLDQSTRKELSSSANLASDLFDLENTYDKLFNKNEAGPVAGRIQKLKSAVGYGNPEFVTASGQIDVGQFKIARLLNGPGVLTDKDIARAQTVAPTMTETPESFKAKLGNVRRMLRESIETWKIINGAQSSPDVIALADKVIADLGGAGAKTPAPATKPPTNMPRINSLEEFNALQPNTWFLDDEGIPKLKK